MQTSEEQVVWQTIHIYWPGPQHVYQLGGSYVKTKREGKKSVLDMVSVSFDYYTIIKTYAYSKHIVKQK